MGKYGDKFDIRFKCYQGGNAEKDSGRERERERERERRRSDTKRMKAITINQKKAIINTYNQRDWFCL